MESRAAVQPVNDAVHVEMVKVKKIVLEETSAAQSVELTVTDALTHFRLLSSTFDTDSPSCHFHFRLFFLRSSQGATPNLSHERASKHLLNTAQHTGEERH